MKTVSNKPRHREYSYNKWYINGVTYRRANRDEVAKAMAERGAPHVMFCCTACGQGYWTAKNLCLTPDGGYYAYRNIFYHGKTRECECPVSELRMVVLDKSEAPEVKKITCWRLVYDNGSGEGELLHAIWLKKPSAEDLRAVTEEVLDDSEIEDLLNHGMSEKYGYYLEEYDVIDNSGGT